MRKVGAEHEVIGRDVEVDQALEIGLVEDVEVDVAVEHLDGILLE